MSARLTPKREAEIRQHLASTDNHSLGNLAARDLLAELDAVREAFAKEERLHEDTMKDRDRFHEIADQLAYAVAPEEVIGEHSSMNCPWENALGLITPMAEVDKLRAERDQARRVVEELACRTCKGSGLDPDDGGDWDSAVGRYNPTTIAPCPTCTGDRTRQPVDAEGEPDNRRRLYVDGKGDAWISVCHDEGTEWVVPVQPAAHVEQDVRDVADETGSLREIGRCW